jgi:high-affinity nickel-transport protein
MMGLVNRMSIGFGSQERLQLASLYGVVALLHALGWGLYLHFAAHYPALIGLGFVAYMLGLRHAFDPDHIAAIDDTVRLMLQRRRPALGVGFFFSLGHSTIVLCLALAIAFAATYLTGALPQLRDIGAVIGTFVSGIFLWGIGVLNLFVLLDLLKVLKQVRTGAHGHRHLEESLARGGFLNRIFRGGLRKVMNHSWQMYPLGLLFGLGFDTASEVGVLTMTAGASAGSLPVSAVVSLPILFAAGMTLMDTSDGVLMTKAYDWALLNPLRKVFYNVTTTGLAVVLALIVGSVELLQVLISALRLRGGLFDAIALLNFGKLGYIVVGLFLLAWGTSVAVWKIGRVEERYRAS